MTTEKLPSYGGQALIEGVLMRGAKYVSAAMRSPEGEIVIQTEKLTGIYESRLKNIPFLRGLLLLWDALGLGIRFLTVSANLQTGEDEKIEGPALYLTLAVSLGLGVLMFFVLPAFIGSLLERFLNFSAWWSNFAEGVIRLLAVIGYIWAIGKMPEIKRVFQYHGAEHKTINAFESGAELSPENVLRYSVQHPRCGTAFLLTLIVFSILLFAALGPLPPVWRILSRVLLIPPLAMAAYEYIRWTAGHLSSPLIRLLVRPNLALQRLTTAEPDAQIVEVAIAAFSAMFAAETSSQEAALNLQPAAQQALVDEGDYQNPPE